MYHVGAAESFHIHEDQCEEVMRIVYEDSIINQSQPIAHSHKVQPDS
jgi:hypothetical protein